MLSTFPFPPGGVPDASPVWIDLIRNEREEVVRVEALTGLHVPVRAELEEIESSSRLAERNGALYLTYPAAKRDEDGETRVTPVGFVLTRERLLGVQIKHGGCHRSSSAAPRSRRAPRPPPRR